jgi:hypothetical protein
MDLDNTVKDISGRLRTLEEELEGEDEDGNSKGHSSRFNRSHASGILKDGNHGFMSGFSQHQNQINK